MPTRLYFPPLYGDFLILAGYLQSAERFDVYESYSLKYSILHLTQKIAYPLDTTKAVNIAFLHSPTPFRNIWRYFIVYWNTRRICSDNDGLPPIDQEKKVL